jgi:hypothetical protein
MGGEDASERPLEADLSSGEGPFRSGRGQGAGCVHRPRPVFDPATGPARAGGPMQARSARVPTPLP